MVQETVADVVVIFEETKLLGAIHVGGIPQITYRVLHVFSAPQAPSSKLV